ncbi:MAG TPA: STAS domain-containing protein [Nitrospirota bacterium]|nr:STAS domain-containing protein [Nitrospirota bacterium]
MSDYEIRQTDKEGELVISGSLTVDNAGRLRKALLDSIERHEDVGLDIAEDAVLDLSFLQLLCSAHRTAVAAKKSFKIRGTACLNMVKAVGESGYLRKTGCSRDRNGSCLWLSGRKV